MKNVNLDSMNTYQLKEFFLLKQKFQQGLSLIELLMAVFIIVILTVAVVPAMIQVYQEYHLNTYAENLYYVLQYARSAAIKNNQTVYVNFHSGDSWCYGVNAGSSCNCTTANSCGLGTYSAPRSQDTSLSSTGLTNSNLSFDGTHGSASVSTITFTLYNGTNAVAVTIGALGNMYLCSNTLSGYSSCP